MPEVIEVFITSNYLDDKLKNKTLTNIKILGGRYKYHKFLINLPVKIIRVRSIGKFIWFELDNDMYIMNTLGLTGMWGFTKNKYSRIKFTGTNFTLYYSDMRNFGTIKISNKKDLDKKIKKLTPSILENFTDREFYSRILDYKKKQDYIISALMNQESGLGSGIGNYLSAEILYRAKISPYTRIKNINRSISNKLSRAIKYIIKWIYMTGNMRYLDEELDKYLIKLRKRVKLYPEIKINTNDEFEYQVYGLKKDKYNHEIVGDKIISGRTTYWCPNIQK
jgi:formamidopyrimidine-DNA glycosylase